MLSRVADSLYWMGRYMERIDGTLRLLQINYALSQDNISDFSWESVLSIFPQYKNDDFTEIEDSRQVLKYMILDKDNPNSLFNMITFARENARSVQDHITKELWQCLNDFYHAIRNDILAQKIMREDPISLLNDLEKFCLIYYGIIDSTLPRGVGYNFLAIGKMIERSMQMMNILSVNFIENDSDLSKINSIFWKHLLLSISGYEMYLKTYRSAFNYHNVFDLIVLNPSFPRSLFFSINHLYNYFKRLKEESVSENYLKMEFKIGKLKNFIIYTSSKDLEEQTLCSFIIHVKTELNDIGNQLNDYYFAYLKYTSNAKI
ncbi:MAG: alpha-E domain-containing protein [Flavobacteriaceae bacterium]|jgi:uncharacterized alpha-E superfamily protein|nr:alpha-E domain-containing protein [Flavobacteriaceae bacterium]